MTSVGTLLRNAREQQERTISEVAEKLCITQGYIRAMESGDLKNLPGIFFYKSFVRQYAALLGIEESALAPALASLTPPEEPAAPQPDGKAKPLFPLDPIVELTNRFYFSEHPLGLSIAGLVAALALCSGFYAWWSRSPQAAAIPSQPTASTATQGSTSQLASPAAIGGVAQVVAVSGNQISPIQAPIQATDQTSVDADGVKHVVLSLSATEKTWLRITSDGQTIFSGVLQPSESKVLKGNEMATMRVGNAAGIDVRLNGKSIGPLGPRGQVRTVRFTRENFEILPPAETVETPTDPKTL